MPQDRPACIGSTPLEAAEACPQIVHILEAYRGKSLAMVPVGITNVTVLTVARQLLWSSGLGEVDSISLQNGLLQFGVASMDLRQIVGEFGDKGLTIAQPRRRTGH